MRINLHWEPMRQRFGLYITKQEGDQTFTGKPLQFGETGRFETIEPVASIKDKTELQELMDSMWSAGLRPSIRADEYRAQLGSMRDHLNDMRAIVFKERNDLT